MYVCHFLISQLLLNKQKLTRVLCICVYSMCVSYLYCASCVSLSNILQVQNLVIVICVLLMELWCHGVGVHPLEGPPPTAAGLPHPHQCISGMCLGSLSLTVTL